VTTALCWSIYLFFFTIEKNKDANKSQTSNHKLLFVTGYASLFFVNIFLLGLVFSPVWDIQVRLFDHDISLPLLSLCIAGVLTIIIFNLEW
jgi:hypothetical protein